jgi:hypothetical protein
MKPNNSQLNNQSPINPFKDQRTSVVPNNRTSIAGSVSEKFINSKSRQVEKYCDEKSKEIFQKLCLTNGKNLYFILFRQSK